MKLRLLFLVVGICLAGSAVSQKAFHGLSSSLGAQWQSVREQTIGPLLYDGPAAAISIAYHSQHAHVKDQLRFVGRFGLLTPELPELSLTNYFLAGGGNIRYYFHFELPWISNPLGWRFWAGPALHASYDLRYHNRLGNSAYTYDGWGSLMGSIGVTRTFLFWRQEFKLDYELAAPLFSLILRPGWVGPVQNVFYLAGPMRQVNWNSVLKYSWVLKNCNEIFMVYDWHFSRFKGGNTIEAATQSLQFGLTYKFNE